MVQFWNLVNELKPIVTLVGFQVCFAGVNILYKLAIIDGMNIRVLVAYRSLFAAAFIVPLAFFIERRRRPKLTWTVLGQAFLCGLFGLEKVSLKSLAGKAKVAGTLVGISGAMLLTFYKGVEIKLWSTNAHLLKQTANGPVVHDAQDRLIGSILALGNCFSYAAWLIVQAKMSERYPSPYSSTALMNIMGSVQAVVFALCMDRDLNQWKLGWNIRLLTVAYSGVVASGVMVTLLSWCIRIKGPLFVSIFNPITLILVALAGSLLLNEKLYLGSVLGAILIVLGLYGVIWGKGKEMKKMILLVPSLSCEDSIEGMDIITSSVLDAESKAPKEHVMTNVVARTGIATKEDDNLQSCISQ